MFSYTLQNNERTSLLNITFKWIVQTSHPGITVRQWWHYCSVMIEVSSPQTCRIRLRRITMLKKHKNRKYTSNLLSVDTFLLRFINFVSAWYENLSACEPQNLHLLDRFDSVFDLRHADWYIFQESKTFQSIISLSYSLFFFFSRKLYVKSRVGCRIIHKHTRESHKNIPVIEKVTVTFLLIGSIKSCLSLNF